MITLPRRLAIAVPTIVLVSLIRFSGSDTPEWLVARAREESRLAAATAVLHDFRFTDRRRESGITFQNRIVDDAGKAYKLVHYDHGNGICAADVDGDGLPDIYLLTQLGTNELWRNEGHGRFVDITASADVRMQDDISVGCAFADIDNDGDPDLLVTTVRHGNRLFENLGAGMFRDITTTAGVGYVGHSAGAVFFDYDGDGLLDLFVANVGVFTSNTRGPGGYYVGLGDALLGHLHPERSEPSILYHNLGGNRFKDVTREVGLVGAGWNGDATVMDVNGDGLPDLFVLDMQGADHLWLNEGGQHFRDATATYFPRTPWGAMGAKVFDADGDGRLDLFLTSMHPDMWIDLPAGDWAAESRKDDPSRIPEGLIREDRRTLIFGNALFEQRRPGRFDEVSDSAGVETYWPWGPSVDDFNADGWDDIFIAAGMNYPFRYGINSLLLNVGGHRFSPSEFVVGVEPRPNGVTEQTWFTLECGGGGPDAANPLCHACRHSPAMQVSCHPTGADRVDVTGAVGTRSAVALDLDNDGDLDLVTNEFNAGPQVLVSDLAQRHRVRFLKVRLRGTKSNREGIGATVTLVLPTRRIVKVNDGKSGYLSQSDLPLYFGLGDATEATEVDVRWPSGTEQRVVGPIQAGQTLEVVEP